MQSSWVIDLYSRSRLPQELKGRIAAFDVYFIALQLLEGFSGILTYMFPTLRLFAELMSHWPWLKVKVVWWVQRIHSSISSLLSNTFNIGQDFQIIWQICSPNWDCLHCPSVIDLGSRSRLNYGAQEPHSSISLLLCNTSTLGAGGGISNNLAYMFTTLRQYAEHINQWPWFKVSVAHWAQRWRSSVFVSTQ